MYCREYIWFKYLEFIFLKPREHPVTYCITIISTDSYLDPSELIRPKLSDNRLDTILSACTSLGTISYFRELHIEIIDEYEDIYYWVNLIKIYNLWNGLTRKIHICSRLEEENFFSIYTPLAHNPRKTRINPIRKTQSFSQGINHEKPNIMSGIFVLVSRITESDYELHNIFVILRNETPALFIRVDCHQRNRLFAGLRMTEKGYEHNSIQKSETKNLPWPRDFLKATTNVVFLW